MIERFSIPARIAIVFMAISLLAALLFARNQGQTLTGQLFDGQNSSHPGYPVLGACTSENNALFEIDSDRIGGDSSPANPIAPDAVDIWSTCYHAMVESVIEEHLGNQPADNVMDILNDCYSHLGDIEVTPGEAHQLDCFAETPETLSPAGSLLKLLASQLAPWQHPDDLEALTASDVGSVLNEYVRTYECALNERSFFRFPRVQEELASVSIRDFFGNVSLDEINKEALEEEHKITQEMQVARPALQRALSLIGGMERLKPLESEVECLQRASLDIRNSFALSAETASCMPRAWDARDALRDSEVQE